MGAEQFLISQHGILHFVSRWVEIRQEVRSHAKALGCNMVVGYQEKTVLCEDVLIMSSSGTAAVCNLAFMGEEGGEGTAGDCSVSHIPYTEASVPFPVKLTRCGVCGRGKVADILLSTVEPPPELEVVGQGGLIQARVLRAKKDLKGENDAREVSDALPFLEYEIHRQLVNKLKVKGMNAIFGLTVSLSLADRMLVGLATGTAVFLPSLPPPSLPKVLDSLRGGKEQAHLVRLQERLREKVEANREHFGLSRESSGAREGEPEEAAEEVLAELDLSAGNKDTCVLEVDDIEDADIVDSLLDAHPPQGFQVVSVHTPVGVEPGRSITRCQAFSQVSFPPQRCSTSSVLAKSSPNISPVSPMYLLTHSSGVEGPAGPEQLSGLQHRLPAPGGRCLLQAAAPPALPPLQPQLER